MDHANDWVKKDIKKYIDIRFTSNQSLKPTDHSFL